MNDHIDDFTNDKPIPFLKFLSQKNLNGCKHETLDELLDCKEKECRKGNEVINAVVHRFIYSGFGKKNPLNETEKFLLQAILTANIVSKISHVLMVVGSLLTKYGSNSKRRGKLRDLWDIDQFLDESISGKIDGTKNSIGFVLTNALLQKMNEWTLTQEDEGGSNAKNL